MRNMAATIVLSSTGRRSRSDTAFQSSVPSSPISNVLVAYYLQERDAGRHKPVARGGIGSLAGRFPVWQAFFENLFAAVGRDGLLANRPAYLAERNDAKDHMVEFALKWFELADKRDRRTVLLRASELFKLLEDERNPDVLCVALPLV